MAPVYLLLVALWWPNEVVCHHSVDCPIQQVQFVLKVSKGAQTYGTQGWHQ